MNAFLLYLGGSVILHFLWEKAQMPLYAVDLPSWSCILRCLQATLTGDLFVMLTIYALLAIAHRDLHWVARPSSYDHPITWILSPLVGLFFAIIIELRAVYVLHRWSYTATMPLIPGLGIGLTPLLQMIVVPLVLLYLCYLVAEGGHSRIMCMDKRRRV